MPYKDPKCQRAYFKAHRHANLERERSADRAHYRANRDRIRAVRKARYQVNREKVLDARKAYCEANPEKVQACNKANYLANRDKRLLYAKVYRENKQESTAAATKAWIQANPERQRANLRARHQIRYKQDPNYAMRKILRSRLKNILKSKGKTEMALRLLGCDLDWLVAWLEIQFQPGMCWDNRGLVWHVDHVRPCASFDLTDRHQQKLCFHWTNLQPLFAADNLKKRDR